MASEWKEIRLDELKANSKNAIAMGPFGSRIKTENFVSFGIPIIKGGNLTADFLHEGNYDYLTPDKADELKSSNAFRRDIIITHRGTIGQVGIIPDNSKFERYVISQSQLKVSLNQEKINPYFVYYFFKTGLGQHRLLMNSSQVGVPAIAKASTSVKSILIPCPELKEQKKIVNFLLGLDKKIQLNKQMNETLEQMAQALFQSWFVDFDPVIDNALDAGKEIPEALQTRAEKRLAVRNAADFKPLPADIRALFPNEFEQSAEPSVGIDGWIPKGWKLLPLDKIADFRNGLALQKFRPEKDSDDFLPVLKIAQLNQGYTDGKEKARTDIKKEYIVNDGDMIFSWSGTLMIDLWTGGKAALNQHLFKVYSEIFPLSIYLHWTKHYLLKFQQIAAGKAVTMGHIKKGDLSSAICLLPSDNLIKKFDEFVSPWIKKYIDTRIENNSLTKLRDTLLPKLISGELRLDQLDAVEELSQQ